MKQYRQYRVRFSLPDTIAEKYDTTEDKSSLVANAVEWYLSFGKESMEKLGRIEAMLASGVRMVKKPEAVRVQKDEFDDSFDEFTI